MNRHAYHPGMVTVHITKPDGTTVQYREMSMAFESERFDPFYMADNHACDTWPSVEWGLDHACDVHTEIGHHESLASMAAWVANMEDC